MRSVLVELGPWQPGVAVALGFVVAVVAVAYDVLFDMSQQHGTPKLRAWRLVAVAAAGAAAGVSLYFLVNYFAPVKVRSWGTMLMIAFGAGLWWMIHDTRNDDEITPDALVDLTIVVLVGAIIGARGLSVWLNWNEFAQAPITVLYIWGGGLSFHGGLAGGLLAGSILIVRRKLPYGRMVDLVAPGLALGTAITRIGCFLNGCCYGAPTNLPWGVRFPELAVRDGGLIPRHPTQLYALVMNLVVFWLLLRIRPHLRRAGRLWLVYLVLYSIGRFIIEFWRKGATAEVFAPLAPLTQAQVASIAIALLAGGWLLVDSLLASKRAQQA